MRFENPIINNDDFANAIAVQALNAEPIPSIPEMALVWDPMNVAIYDIVTGKASAENALNKAKYKFSLRLMEIVLFLRKLKMK